MGSNRGFLRFAIGEKCLALPSRSGILGIEAEFRHVAPERKSPIGVRATEDIPRFCTARAGEDCREHTALRNDQVNNFPQYTAIRIHCRS